MKLEITGRNIDISPAIRDFTRDKLSRLDRWIDEIMEVHVVLSVEKHRHQAEIAVKGRHHTFTGTEETGDMYVSIGNAVDKIDKQARRQKDKVSARRKHGVPVHDAASRPGPAGQGANPGADADVDAEAGSTSSQRVIRSTPAPMKPMSVDDAALLFRDSDRDFLVFREARSQRINVMYRRRDGHLGLIESLD